MTEWVKKVSWKVIWKDRHISQNTKKEKTLKKKTEGGRDGAHL